MEDSLEQLEQALGHEFKDKALLRTALTHPSYAVEQSPPAPDNQRLEFLGDAVLQFFITQFLFSRFPDLAEGKLTKVRSALIKESALVDFANQLGLGPCLLLGKGERRGGGGERPSNLADAFEAVLAALLLDGGLRRARALCRRLAASALTDVEEVLADENPKGALQELVQELHQTTPTYEVLRVSGPEHEPLFEVKLSVASDYAATAKGRSRKAAEQEAAKIALRELTRDDQAE